MAKAIDTATYKLYVIRQGASSLLSKEFPLGTAFVRIDQATPRSCFYYEGNIYGAVNLHKFTEKALCAAGRARTEYPTIAKAWFSTEEIEENFIHIGSIDSNYVSNLSREGISLLEEAIGAENIGPYEAEHLEPYVFMVGEQKISFRTPSPQDAQDLLLMRFSGSSLFSGRLGAVGIKAPDQNEFTMLVPSTQG